MLKNFKNILSWLLIAKKKNKKILKLKYCKLFKTILYLLWNQGFIYGFLNKKNLYFLVFIKYSEKGSLLFQRLKYLNKWIQNRTLKNLYFLNLNNIFFLINDKGFFCSKIALKVGIGGYIFVKI